MTNFGATLAAVMLGMTGLDFGDSLAADPSAWATRVGALPAGWERVTFGAWMGGRRYSVESRHDKMPTVTLMEADAGGKDEL